MSGGRLTWGWRSQEWGPALWNTMGMSRVVLRVSASAGNRGCALRRTSSECDGGAGGSRAYARRAETPSQPEASEQADGAQVTATPARIGFSVSKRVGSAVIRNRVKRRLREAIRRRLWKTQPGWDMILIARPEAADAQYAALADEVYDLLRRARLLR